MFTTATCKQVELTSPVVPYYFYQFSYKDEVGGKMSVLPLLPPGKISPNLDNSAPGYY